MEEEELTNDSRNHLLLLNKEAHDKKALQNHYVFSREIITTLENMPPLPPKLRKDLVSTKRGIENASFIL